ncbi:MAG: ORF6N domain-containing protein [Sulfurimonas sp.]|jgi:hypothetical protein
MDLVTNDNIETKIYTIRSTQVMLDRDLAILYGVETKHINQAVRNNRDKFPDDFYFELSNIEFDNLRSKFLTANFSMLRSNPKVFTEQGIYMLATILKSKVASDVTISIIRTFANIRRFIHLNKNLFEEIDDIKKQQWLYEKEANNKFEKLFNTIEDKKAGATQGIFYDGQIYDAYSFISNLIRTTKKDIILIDNYIDDTVLTLFSKVPSIQITIYTNVISKQLKLDFEKYSVQYVNVKLQTFKNSHDRFLIIDNKEIYHIGASLKDLGKKWFAFSKIDISIKDILDKLI